MNFSNDSANSDFMNVSLHLKHMAKIQPYKRAVIYPLGKDEYGRIAYTHLTFQQLDRESDIIAHGLEKAGIRRGMRTVLMVKPSLEFFAVTFALFKTGAVPVVVDPGMGISRLIRCLNESRPRAFIGISKAHLVRILFPKYFKTVKHLIIISRHRFWRGITLKEIYKAAWKPYPVAKTRRNEIAAILFTTGSTGPAKGTVYTHGTFDAQIRTIRSHFNITTDEIDLPTFPLFALFDPALGMTAVIPDMDFTKPANVNPCKIIEAAEDQGITNMFASPALLDRVGLYGEKKGVKLPSLKRVISAGAPVSPSVIERFAGMLGKDAEIHTPYGATEAMPAASICSSEILSETGKLSKQGFGICVGRPVDGIELKIIKISDHPVDKWSDDLIVPESTIGEIVVKGDLVTRSYFKKTEAQTLSKINEKDQVWHRMGDLGWMDRKGRIWFCGRKSHRVKTEKRELYTIPCEAVFNNHPQVFRSALVGIGPRSNQKPVICIELNHDKKSENRAKLEKELLELAKSNMQTEDISTILFHRSFPVDIRHNAKIFREKLAIWAENRLS